MDPDFLRKAQVQGWNIITADEQHVWLGCARVGCNFQFKVRDGGAIPATCRPKPQLAEIPVESFEEMLSALRGRREQLCLSIKDVENASGMADDHLAKIESGGKIPNIETTLIWLQALGYTVVLRQTGIPMVTLGLISRTRRYVKQRLHSFRYFRDFRAKRK